MEPTPDLTPQFLQLLLPELARESAKTPAPRLLTPQQALEKFKGDKTAPFERMMKEVPHPGWDNDDPCKGCRYYKECKGKKKQCRKKFRALIVEPRPSGHRGPKS